MIFQFRLFILNQTCELDKRVTFIALTYKVQEVAVLTRLLHVLQVVY